MQFEINVKTRHENIREFASILRGFKEPNLKIGGLIVTYFMPAHIL